MHSQLAICSPPLRLCRLCVWYHCLYLVYPSHCLHSLSKVSTILLPQARCCTSSSSCTHVAYCCQPCLTTCYAVPILLQKPQPCLLPVQGVSTDPEKLGPKAAVVDGKNVLQLLNHCSGSFRPGILTALVGSSGAGKTTLMDVLAGRKTSKLLPPVPCHLCVDKGMCNSLVFLA